MILEQNKDITKIPQLITFCTKCYNCNEIICVNRYSKQSGFRDLQIAIIQHLKDKGCGIIDL